jgi:hypothetical protein
MLDAPATARTVISMRIGAEAFLMSVPIPMVGWRQHSPPGLRFEPRRAGVSVLTTALAAALREDDRDSGVAR